MRSAPRARETVAVRAQFRRMLQASARPLKTPQAIGWIDPLQPEQARDARGHRDRQDYAADGEKRDRIVGIDTEQQRAEHTAQSSRADQTENESHQRGHEMTPRELSPQTARFNAERHANAKLALALQHLRDRDAVNPHEAE